jgi:FkbM family methyltransferase
MIQKLSSAAELTTEYRTLARAGLLEHPDCLSWMELGKFYLPWLMSVIRDQDALPEARPWITFAAAEFLSKLLSEQSRVFEFGAGGSTLFFARRVGELVTVEHDRGWIERTASKLHQRRDFVWKTHLEEPIARDQSGDPSAQPYNDYASTDPNFAGMSFHSYATSIERYDDNYFDVILIDGRARVACFKHAIAKVKFGGYIVLDNAEREEYAAVEQMARKLGFEIRDFWGPGPYNRYFWRTIFMKRVEDHFALDDLDSKLERYLDFDGGTFVEAGANDGVSQSNTLYFERRRGWRGLLIEPIPELAEQCRKHRPRACVEQSALVSADRGAGPVVMRVANLMSTVKGSMKSVAEEDLHIAAASEVQNIAPYELAVKSDTLSSILDKHDIKDVDLLTLDVEGAELSALRGIDFSRHKPRFILVEARYRDEVHLFLSERYDLIDELTFRDLLYRLKAEGDGKRPHLNYVSRNRAAPLQRLKVPSVSDAPAIFLINQQSRHGHLDLYARLYSACLLELGYRVVLIAEHESGISEWIFDNCKRRFTDFLFVARSDVQPGDAAASGPGRSGSLWSRVRRNWRERGLLGVLVRVVQFEITYFDHWVLRPINEVLVRVVQIGIKYFNHWVLGPLKIEYISHSWGGISFEPLVDEINAAGRRIGLRPDLVFFLYLDMINDDRKGCHYLARHLDAPWVGIRFDPRCWGGEGKARPENFFSCGNARGAAFLNPHCISTYERLFPALRFGALPDVTDATVLPADSPLIVRLRSSARGRTIVLQLGSLSPHKGLMELIEIIRRADSSRFYFAIIGELFWDAFGGNSKLELQRFVESPPENCLVQLGYLQDERELNSVIAASDILYAVYKNFRQSSNTLTKAALFEKPVIVSDQHLMGERVVRYQLGETVRFGNLADTISALERLRQRKRGDFNFAAYRRDHSVEALEKNLAILLEGWLRVPRAFA